MSRRGTVTLCLGLVTVMFAACSSTHRAGGGSASPVGNAPSTAGQTPNQGGSLTFGVYSETISLDPAVSTGGGTTGATELAALYDTIMRFNQSTGTYEPKTAQSLTPNTDFTQWTLKLRPNIQFSDGTPYNAAAVEYNFKRDVAKRQPAAVGFLSRITNYNIVDVFTIEFTLNAPWSGFPFVFAYNLGSIASPTAIQKLGDQQFSIAPVGGGAGPFLIESFKPGEGIAMKRNPNYWGGDVHLDELRFVHYNGAVATYQAMKTGAVQAALLAEPPVVRQAQQDGTPGVVDTAWAGDVLLINNGVNVACSQQRPTPACIGMPDGTKVPTPTPTADKRLRQAIAAAVDPRAVDQRDNQGQGYPGTELFQKNSKWYMGTPGPAYDPQRARSLVKQVEAEGKWDGSIRLECDNSPTRQAEALAVSAMLESVGFKVDVNTKGSVAAVTSDVIVKKDFDLACSGINVFEEDPFVNLSQRLQSNSPSNWMGSVSPAIDNAIKTGGTASTTAQRKAVFDQFAKAITDDVPLLILGAVPYYVAWNKSVHDVEPNVTGSAQFDKAWIG
jgi:peptide/nickel transport system substrate-binding protein